MRPSPGCSAARPDHAAPLEVVDLGESALFAFVRRHEAGPLLAVHDLTEREVVLDGTAVGPAGLDAAVDGIAPGAAVVRGDGRIPTPGYSARWLVSA